MAATRAARFERDVDFDGGPPGALTMLRILVFTDAHRCDENADSFAQQLVANDSSGEGARVRWNQESPYASVVAYALYK